MAFAEVVFKLRKINPLPSKCIFFPPRSLFATRPSARSTHTSTGPQSNSTACSVIGRRSFGLFEFKQQVKNLTNSCSARRWYSDKASDRSSRKRDEKDEDDDETSNDNKHQSKRSIPKLGDDVIVWPNFFRTISNTFNLTYAQFFYDRQFSLVDFFAGAKHALQVISHKLAAGDFDNLRGLVDANELERVKGIVEQMTIAQRSELAIVKDDVYFTFPYDVVITKNEEDDSESKTKRVFVEVLVVFHVLRGLKQLRESDVEIPLNIRTTPEFTKDLWIVNYGFRKELTRGVEDEWTVNLIKQIKSIDELED